MGLCSVGWLGAGVFQEAALEGGSEVRGDRCSGPGNSQDSALRMVCVSVMEEAQGGSGWSAGGQAAGEAGRVQWEGGLCSR